MGRERILLVEDESLGAGALQATLIRLGFDVPETALNAEEAFEAARATRPDLVLIDVVLADHADGIETARRIQTQLHIPHVYCTAHLDDAFASRAKDTDPLGFIGKPILESDLKLRLEMAFHRARTIRQRWESEGLASALASLGDGVIVSDPAGHVTFMNPAAEQLTGWPPAEARGRLLGEVFPLLDEASSSACASLTAELLRKEGWGGGASRVLFAPRLGVVKAVEACASPMTDIEGALTGVVVVFRDTTEKRTRERAIEASNERFRLVSLATNDVIWDWDIRSDLVEWNEGLERLFGYGDVEDSTAGDWWTERIHPEDSDRVLSSISGVCDARNSHWAAEYRFRRADGSYAVVDDRGYVVYESDGTPARMIGCMTDISGRKALEDERLLLLEQERAARADAEAARRRSNFLSEAGQILGSSLDYHATLARVANIAVRAVCDWFAVDIVDRDGTLRRVALTHAEPGKSAVAAILRGRAPDPAAEHGVPLVLSSHRAQLWSAVSELPEPIFESILEASAAADFESAARFGVIPDPGLQSCMIVPILVQDSARGAITFASAREERRYAEKDLEMASDLALRIASALEINALYEEVRESVRMRDEFLAIAAHEIRGPATTLQMHLERIVRVARSESGEKVPPPLLERLEMMRGVGARLVVTMDQLLDLSRLTFAQLTLADEECDLANVVREILPAIEHETIASGCRITTSLPEGVVGRWDSFRMRQVAANLISNALKYGKGKPVRIAVRADATTARLEVSDEGIGIAPPDRERIFERYTRVGSRNDVAGLGIGLHIVRQIVDLHGGRLEVKSAPGFGSAFIVELPRNPAGDASPRRPEPRASGKRILVVDDCEDLRFSLATLLIDDGYEVTEATDGRDALGRLRAERLPDLILTDIAMPVMAGPEFIGELRKDPLLATIPVVLISGAGEGSETAARLGVADFLDKGRQSADILDCVNRYCAR
jgi:PAS domain S-box-containing protein